MLSHINFQYRSLLHCLWAVLLLGILGCLIGDAGAQEVVTPEPMKPAVTEFKEAMPPAPANGILDLAEVFQTEGRKALEDKIKQFRSQENFQIYVDTHTFIFNEDANQRAERLSRQWLVGRQGAVIVYDKGSTGSSAVMGMAWRQDDARELPPRTVKGILLSAKAASEEKADAQPSERLQAAVAELMAGYSRVRPLIDEHHQAMRRSQWKILACVLGIMLLALAILSFTQRFQKKLAQKDAESYLFPHAEIASRYGAPYGGGVVVQLHYGTKGE
jgi:cytochrome bd-type quinol oxidase subunit 1